MAANDWQQMTDSQKIDYLRQWCEQLTRALEQRAAQIDRLEERLRAIEHPQVDNRS